MSIVPLEEEGQVATELLDGLLHEYGLYESELASVKRERILGNLYRICKEWVESVMEKRGYARSVIKNAGVKICTSGSYRLGVHGPGSDIDTLCVAPMPVTLDDFFDSLHKMLEANREVTELTKVPGAHVPVMTMEFSGIQIDLLFVSLPILTIPPNLDLLSTDNLKGLDDRSVRAMNGCRVSDAMLKLVPNIPSFRLTLRCIKLWADRRGIYGNAVGFPGGVAWALLTARVCQLFPTASASTLLSRFYRCFVTWPWPGPVHITPATDLNLGHRVWNPRQFRADGAHLMPIITPVYPCMNTTFNVTKSTLSIIQSELERGLRITNRIDEPGAFRDVSIWSELFQPVDFFSLYDFYLQVQVSGADEIETRSWMGWVQSRLRHLVALLERVPGLKGGHPNIKAYDHKEPGLENMAFSFFIGLMRDTPTGGSKQKLDISQAVIDFKTLYVFNFETKTESMQISFNVVSSSAFPAFLGIPPKPKTKTKRPSKRSRAAQTPSVPANQETTSVSSASSSSSSPQDSSASASSSSSSSSASSSSSSDQDATPNSSAFSSSDQESSASSSASAQECSTASSSSSTSTDVPQEHCPHEPNSSSSSASSQECLLPTVADELLSQQPLKIQRSH